MSEQRTDKWRRKKPTANAALVYVTGNKTNGTAIHAAHGAKLTSSLVIDGKHSNILLPGSSVSFYVFSPSNMPIQGWKLAKLKQKRNKRELPYMKTGAYTGSKSNLEDMPLMSTRITEELYNLQSMANLEKGEYAWVYIENGVPTLIYDFAIEENLPPYPEVPHDVLFAEFYPSTNNDSKDAYDNSAKSDNIIRWYFDSDPRGARIFYRVIAVAQDIVDTLCQEIIDTLYQ